MRTIETTAYTLDDLKESHPDGYARVLERWREACYSGYSPWTDETMDSLRAVVEACGAKMADWNIGVGGGWIRVEVEDEYEYTNATGEHTAPKGARWFRENVLEPNGYVGRGKKRFPGHCKFTGYCADDDFLEFAYERICKGDTLTEALESLALLASEMMEADMEQHCEPDLMHANWDHHEFDEDGNML